MRCAEEPDVRRGAFTAAVILFEPAVLVRTRFGRRAVLHLASTITTGDAGAGGGNFGSTTAADSIDARWAPTD